MMLHTQVKEKKKHDKNEEEFLKSVKYNSDLLNADICADLLVKSPLAESFVHLC